MTTKIYVGNLPFSTTDDRLREAFEQFGEVASASVVMDRDTGRSRGFGFVEMTNAEEAQNAINGMNGQAIDGRSVTVNEARPREERAGGGGGFRRGGGGGVVVAAVAVAAAATATRAVAAAGTGNRSPRPHHPSGCEHTEVLASAGTSCFCGPTRAQGLLPSNRGAFLRQTDNDGRLSSHPCPPARR
jgi:RNA recognition motif-containing protein